MSAGKFYLKCSNLLLHNPYDTNTRRMLLTLIIVFAFVARLTSKHALYSVFYVLLISLKKTFFTIFSFFLPEREDRFLLLFLRF